MVKVSPATRSAKGALKVVKAKGPRGTLRRMGVSGKVFAKSLKAQGKIRVGILYGKDFDPVKVGTQLSSYPAKAKCKNNTGPKAGGWGGQFHIDVNSGLEIARLHPDIFKIDIISGREFTPARLKKNHVNFAFWHDPMVARRDASFQKAGHVRDVDTCFKDPNCRLWPNWNLVNWIAYKPSYMKQCMAAGIPMIPTIFVDDGFRPAEVLRKVRARGWDKFFVKVGYAAFFGEGAINGKTTDFINNPVLLETFAKENKQHKCFLVQPYMLKPNGDVFDEIRNYFVDGVWQTGVFTHGTDMSDAGYYEQPPGKLRDAARELATRAYKQALKVSKFHGKPIDTLLSRIDIGIIPDRSKKLGYRIFVNEIEPETATWLARYWPTDMAKIVGPACVKKGHELLKILLSKGHKLPDAAMVRRNMLLLEERSAV